MTGFLSDACVTCWVSQQVGSMTGAIDLRVTVAKNIIVSFTDQGDLQREPVQLRKSACMARVAKPR